MCGIVGIFNRKFSGDINVAVLEKMAEVLNHRGPDETSIYAMEGIGFGFKRLSIIDLKKGHQPFFSEDRQIVAICNGEIFNHHEIRDDLKSKGVRFRTNCDIEVLPYLYQIYGCDFVSRLNGQFAIAIYDHNIKELFLYRDNFGICPLFYTQQSDSIIFGSEIKAILQYPQLERRVNLTGLDQVFSFPGLVSPESIFKDIRSVNPGTFLRITDQAVIPCKYWDLDYPKVDFEYEDKPEKYYLEELESRLLDSVRYRLQSDVDLGFYLSGGLDSSLIGAFMTHIQGTPMNSFSISFPDELDNDKNEREFQLLAADHLGSNHHEIPFDWNHIESGLKEAVYHSECPLKETYNTCSIALSRGVRESGIKVILSGEGADELFGGYVGYRFDQSSRVTNGFNSLHEEMEGEIRQRLWGDSDFFYEKKQFELLGVKKAVFSESLSEGYEQFSCLDTLQIDHNYLHDRHPFHKRSYLDVKLRLSDHLISDHCDRTCYANSIEGRYPFLDPKLVEFVRLIPPWFNLNNMVEKSLLKSIGRKYLPQMITDRQKFGFIAPGSPSLLQNNIEWINDLLSYDQIRRQGYFNPDTIERLKQRYGKKGFKLNQPFEDDWLITVITFNIMLELFELPCV